MNRILAIAIVLLFVCLELPAQMITTMAGTGVQGLSGDNGNAALAQVHSPGDGVVDASGNYYFLDSGGTLIRRIDATTGVITVYAGTGVPGFSGDGPATSVKIWATGLAIDASGNIYLADGGNNRVRKINASNLTIQTLCGTGTSQNTGDSGLAINASIIGPADITIDGNGNIYSSTVNTIRMISTSGVITTVASNSSYILRMAVDNSGGLYFSDNNYRIRKLNLSNWSIITVAGDGTGGDGGLAINASLVVADGISTDGNNNVYIAGNSRVRKITVSTGIIDRVAGSATTAGFGGDWGLATSSMMSGSRSAPLDNNSNMYIADEWNYRIRKVWSCFNTVTSPSAANQSVCQNGTATALTVSVSGTGSITYQWYSNTTSSNVGGTLISGATGTSYTPPSVTPGTLYYYVRISGTCGTVPSAVSGAITILPGTNISAHPSTSPQTLCQHSAGPALSLTATGAGTLTYQWYSNATNSNVGGTLVPGATNAIYIPNELGTRYYYVRVMGCNLATSNTSGAITVTPVTYALGGAPSSAVQSVCQNGTTTALSVSATGTAPLTYQWYANNIQTSSGGTLIPGATGVNFTPPSSTVGTTYYYAIASGPCGSSTSQASGAINITLPTAITTQPSTSPQGICLNGTASALSVVATGALTYQWYWNALNNNTSGTPIAGASSSTYTPPTTAIGTRYYYVVATGCLTATSATSGPVTVYSPTYFSVQPVGGPMVCQNSPVTPLSATAVGLNITYQWYSDPSASYAGTPISGATSASYTPSSSVVGNMLYYVVATGSCGSAFSQFAGVLTSTPVTITAQPSSAGQSVCLNGTVTPLSIAATASPYPNIQWYKNTANNNTTGTPISGAYNLSYTPPATPAGTNYYYVKVGCNVVTSTQSGAITINALTAVTVHPSTGTQTVCQNAAMTALSVTAAGSGLTYQWYSNTTNANSGGTAIGGATTNSYTPSSAVPGVLYYYVTVTGICGSSTSNVSGARTVNAATGITVHPNPSPQPYCQNATTTALTVTAVGTGTLTYQWYSNTTSSNTGGTSIGGATTASYSPPSTTTGVKYYYVRVTSSCGGTVTSNVSGAITINSLTAISGQPSSSPQTVCQNGTTTALTVTATGTSLTYQWYSNTTPSYSGSTPIPGATSPSFTPPSSTAGVTYYYVVVAGTCGSLQSSFSGAITVNLATAITAHPSTTPQTVCQNAATTALSATAVGTGTLTYQWYSNTTASNTGGTSLGGATTTSYTPLSTTAGVKYYYVTVSGTCGGPVPSIVSGAITINPTTAITVHPSTTAQSVCPNGSITPLTVTAAGAGLSYQWYSNTTANNSGGSSIGGATTTSYAPPSNTVGVKYYYVTASGTCGGPIASNVSGAITVNPTTTITTHPSTTAQNVCPSGSITALSVAASGAGLSYQWYSNTTASNNGGSAIYQATGTTFLPLMTAPGVNYYYATVTGACGSPKSNVSGAITVNLVGGEILVDGDICYGQAVLTAGGVSGGSGWSWVGGPNQQTQYVYFPDTYTVNYSMVNGCPATASVTLNFDNCGGSCQVCPRKALEASDESEEDPTANFSFGVYPNPASGTEVLIVLTEPAKEDCPIQVFDLLGRLSKTAVVEKGQKSKTLNIADLHTGVYIVDIKDNKRKRQRKLIVQRN